MKILISAAEASSDAHGAELLKAIQKILPQTETVEAFGIGGPKLQAAGLEVIVDARELLAMGFVEVLGHLPRIFRALRRVAEVAAKRRPDLVIVVDYPDFHFRLAKALHKHSIPVVYYITPKVWVWRKKRVELLRRFFVKLLCILPFEEGFYKNLNIPAKYVGNPLVDELPLYLTREEARKKLGLSPLDRILVLMPGSRASELKYHLDLFLESAAASVSLLRASGFLRPEERLKILMPFPMTASWEKIQASGERNQRKFESLLDIHLSQGNAAECLVAADAGLIKSGTSTLEAGLLRCPHTVIYKPSRTTAWIFKYLIRYQGPVGLVNLVTGWKPGQDYLVPEILCEKVTLEALTQEIVSLMTDSKRRQILLEGFEKIRQQVAGTSPHQSPSLLAAKEIFQLVQDLKSQAVRSP